MKTHQLLENNDLLYVKATERMFANFGMPDITKRFKIFVVNDALIRLGGRFEDPNIEADIGWANVRSNVQPTNTFHISIPNMKRDIEEIVDFIKKDGNSALAYAAVTGRPWPPGERAIRRGLPMANVMYAKHAVKGRWRSGERIILRDGTAIIQYAFDVLQQRWPAGEKVLLDLERPMVCLTYTQLVIKARWPEAEHILSRDTNAWRAYEKL